MTHVVGMGFVGHATLCPTYEIGDEIVIQGWAKAKPCPTITRKIEWHSVPNMPVAMELAVCNNQYAS